MNTTDLWDEIATKGSDKGAIAERLIRKQASIAGLIEGMKAKPGDVKFGCEKVLQEISAQCPALVYPYFQQIVGFMEGGNKILKWGAILILANLAAVDTENHFASSFDRYYHLITGPDMITAASVIAGSVKIVRAHPEWAERIKKEILKVEKATYKTPECRNVAIGHALDALMAFDDLVEDKKSIRRFAQRQLNNTRKTVVVRAKKFLARGEAEQSAGDCR